MTCRHTALSNGIRGGGLAAADLCEEEKMLKKRRRTWADTWLIVRKNYQVYLILLPAIAYYILFKYVPMYGLQIAFRNYKPAHGIWGSKWVGLDNFVRFLTREYFWMALRNSLVINIASIVFTFPLPIIFALMLNELRFKRTKSLIQTITYAPHFISVVVVVSMIKLFLSPTVGLFNNVRKALGLEVMQYLMRPNLFVPIYIISDVWQGLGWSAIIYIASLAGVSPSLHESAMIDGATRMQRIWYINLPHILPTIIILLIMRTGSVLNVGFEKVFLLSNDAVLEKSEVISTYVYRIGIGGGQFSLSTAVGFTNSIVQFIILALVNAVSKRVSETSLW